MLKFLHVYKNYYLGLSLMGIVALFVQEIPYIIMPLVKPKTNPIMNMQDEVKWIAVVPLQYLFFGLWRENYALVGTATVFFIIHTVNGYMNFIKK